MAGKSWTDAEREALARLYPTATQADILAALPERKWGNISKQAGKFKIKRRRPRTARRLPVNPLLVELREARIAAGLTRR